MSVASFKKKPCVPDATLVDSEAITRRVDRASTVARYRQHVNAGMARIFDLMNSPMEIRSEGAYVFDQDDQRYLDCGGYCVFLLGHRHPAVLRAVTGQLGRHPLSSRVMIDPVLAHAAATLASVAPEGLDYVSFTNSGAEASELAIKLTRLHGCGRIISAVGGFHGKTTGALSISGRERYRTQFEPLLPGVERVPFGDVDAIASQLASSPSRSAVFLEPIQSEAGVIIPPASYLADVRALCDRHGALLVFDEISTGLGRTGAWWCANGVRPDIMLVGKALGGGIVPASAVVTNQEIYAPINRDPLLHTSTFAANPLVAAAAAETIATIEREGIVDRAARIGEQLLAEVRALLDKHNSPLVTEARGRGLLLGIEMREEHYAAELLLELTQRRVLVSHSLHAHPVVRLTPPALLTEADRAWLLGALDESLAVVTERYREHAR